MKPPWKVIWNGIGNPLMKGKQQQANTSREQQSGFTLIELLAGLALSGLIILLISSVLILGVRLYEQIETEAILRSEADAIMTTVIEQLYNYHPASLYEEAYNLPGEMQFRAKNMQNGIQIYYVLKMEPDRILPNTALDLCFQDDALYLGEQMVNHPQIAVNGRIQIEESAEEIEAKLYGQQEGVVKVELILIDQESGEQLETRSRFGF